MPKLSSLLTLGTAAGPSLQPDRAQSSNLLTVNGTHYVVDAGDGGHGTDAFAVSAGRFFAGGGRAVPRRWRDLHRG